MANDSQRQDEVTVAKARLLAAAARPVATPAALRVAPAILNLFRRGDHGSAESRQSSAQPRSFTSRVFTPSPVTPRHVRPVRQHSAPAWHAVSRPKSPLVKLAAIAAGAFVVGLMLGKKDGRR